MGKIRVCGLLIAVIYCISISNDRFCACIVFSSSCSTELGSGVVSTAIYCGTSNSPVAVQDLVMPVVITIEHSRIVRVRVTASNGWVTAAHSWVQEDDFVSGDTRGERVQLHGYYFC